MNGIFFIYSKFIWKIIDIAKLPNHFILNSTNGITLQKLSILIIIINSKIISNPLKIDKNVNKIKGNLNAIVYDLSMKLYRYWIY